MYLEAFAGSSSSMVIGMLAWVLYRRCAMCKSHLKLSWLDCESPAVEELRMKRQKTAVLEALRQHQEETLRSEV